jgi:hypothetical protein
LPGKLLAHVPVGDLVQFRVDQRRQLVEGRLVARRRIRSKLLGTSWAQMQEDRRT